MATNPAPTDQIRVRPAPRASSPTDPNEWTITEDGFRFGVGHRLWDYYDGRWVICDEDPAATHDGWFWVISEETGGRSSINSVRVSARKP